MTCKTDTQHPDYYHKVVDCQWACPAHTNVPEYIRLIADGRYTESYLLNRKSNVFPGVLGRVCDRPCEPACRRGRLEDKPVAICRLKRVAADHKDDVKDLLPKVPKIKNGKRVAVIGSGPASLTVANDLLPLGYEVVLFEKENKLGGAMRLSVPGFRLPESVLDEEISFVVDRGVKVHLGTPITSLKALVEESWDAVFVGTGAPKGRDLLLPGRKEAQAHVHIGLDWLAQVAFGHVDKVGKKVIVIGGGNTAMDCCRTALRLGAKSVRVVAPESYEQMLASPWEKEDAEAEGVKMENNWLPKSFEFDAASEQKSFVGVRFQKLKSLFNEKRQWDPVEISDPSEVFEADDVILAIGQSTSFPFIERDMGIAFNDQDRPVVDPKSFTSTHPKVFFGGDAAFGPKNIIWAVAHGHEAAISIHLKCESKDLEKDRLPKGVNLISQKMGMHEWSYENQFDEAKRQAVPHLAVAKRFEDLHSEVELGFSLEAALKEAKRCLNCDVQTVFVESLCIECDACIDICPLVCLTLAPDGLSETDLRLQLNVPAKNLSQALLVSDPLADTKRVMVKDEDLCLHCGLCAERCPTGAWDMQKLELKIPHAEDFLHVGS